MEALLLIVIAFPFSVAIATARLFATGTTTIEKGFTTYLRLSLILALVITFFIGFVWLGATQKELVVLPGIALVLWTLVSSIFCWMTPRRHCLVPISFVWSTVAIVTVALGTSDITPNDDGHLLYITSMTAGIMLTLFSAWSLHNIANSKPVIIGCNTGDHAYPETTQSLRTNKL